MWLIVEFTRAAGGAGHVIQRGLTESNARHFVEILDRQKDGTGTIHFAYAEDDYDHCH